MREKQFETERLFFFYWTENDQLLADKLWADEQVTRFIAKNGILSKEQILQRLTLEVESQTNFGFQYWPLFIKEEDTFIGCCGLHDYDSKKQIAELGFHLVPEAWGKGFAEEASRGVIAYATRETELQALFAGHHPENLASKRLLEKLGFQFQSKEYYEPTGLEHPSYLLKLDRTS